MSLALWLCTFAIYFASSHAATSCDEPPLDICIVIDRTKSVGAKNYDTMLESVRTLISKYNVGPDKTHISIVTFAGDATVRASLDDLEFQTKEGLNKLIDDMKAKDKLGNPTRTDIALEVVNNDVFTAKNGDRPDSPNVMIVFTDGGKFKKSKPYSEVLPPLASKGVHRVAVGIGKNIRQEELETIAGSPDRVVNATSFEELDEQLDIIKETTCKIDGGYTEWSEWSECSETCGGGVQWQSRTCTNPKPENGGKSCQEQELGPDKQSRECNTEACGVDGGYTEWSEWSECSETCGGGVQWQSRTCTNPKPENGGKSCEDQELGPDKQSRECNTQACPCGDVPLDVCIVIDKTKSLGKKHFVSLLESVQTLISKYDVGPDKTHIAIVTFAGRARVRASLDDPNFHSRSGLNLLIEEMKTKEKLGRPTRPDTALEVASNEVFIAENGDRPDSPNVLIMFTDGGKHKTSKPLSEVLPSLEEKAVHRVVVGIGRKIKQKELEAIAGSPERVVNADSFEELDEQLENIQKTACNRS